MIRHYNQLRVLRNSGEVAIWVYNEKGDYPYNKLLGLYKLTSDNLTKIKWVQTPCHPITGEIGFLAGLDKETFEQILIDINAEKVSDIADYFVNYYFDFEKYTEMEKQTNIYNYPVWKKQNIVVNS